MTRTPVDLATLLAVVDAPQAADDLAAYFRPALPGAAPVYSGSRFEFLAGGGDRPETADVITTDDLVAVTLLRVDVPGDVALHLLEGDLGREITRHLEQIPTDVGISDPAAAALLADGGPADVAWHLLEQQHGMGWVVTNKLLARKRPRLIPVYDTVVACALGSPAGLWNWLVPLFADGELEKHLVAARERAGIPAEVTPLRVLDVVVWMDHRTAHQRQGCTGPTW
jgi:hypothetical protein